MFVPWLVAAHLAGEEGGQVDEDAEEDDGEDVAEDGGAAAVPALVVRLVHHREEDGDEALHGDGDSHVDTENQLLLFVNFPSLRHGGRNSIMFSGLCILSPLVRDNAHGLD